MAELPVSVVVLTYNEEKNIEGCLESVRGWVKEIFVVDSYSTDRTLEVAGQYTDKIFQHPFENYSRQRNWALENLPFAAEWVMNLDADHRVTEELKKSLHNVLANDPGDDVKGFLVSRKTIFMDKWIRHGGHYPTYHAVLFRKGYGFCEERLYDQHFIVKGKSKVLRGDIIDIIADSLTRFTERHNKWASLEAAELILSGPDDRTVKPDIWGNKIQKRRFLRHLYNRLPLFVRPSLYFIYRYFLRLGFLDGREGLIFHFLQGFWYRFLADAKIYEIKKRAKAEKKDLGDVINEFYGIKKGGKP